MKYILIFSVGLFIACATYQSKIKETRDLLKQGQLVEALSKLKILAEKKSDDQLVYLLDYGTALQIDKKYEESNQIFLKADKLAEIVDYHSVSNVTLATLGSEEMIQYKGENYEKILINAFLATNYLMLGKNEDALVEVRRINQKINKIRLDGRETYEQNPYANFLAGLIWESDRSYDDAYISFNDSYKISGANPFLAEDLIRTAKKSKRLDEYNKWKKEFPTIEENPDWYKKNMGELVIIFQQGWGPEKHFSPDNHRFPKLYPSFNRTKSLHLNVDNNSKEYTSRVVYDLEGDAIRTFNDDVGWMVARKVGAAIAKEVVADQIRQKDQTLGDIAWLVMQFSDRADLRQWSTLPQTIQMIRVWLPQGTHRLSLNSFDSYGSPTGDQNADIDVQINSGRKTFYNFRSLK